MTWTVIERKGVKPYKPRYQAIKRLVELLFCLITAPIMIPMGAMIALAIRLDSSGPKLVKAVGFSEFTNSVLCTTILMTADIKPL